jgi:acyl carrier protein
MLDRVAKVFNIAFLVSADTVSAATKPEDVARWDSLGHMNLVAALEREFDVTFEVDEIMSMASVGDILDVLTAKTGAGAAA